MERTIGVLALQGDVTEHIRATEKAIRNLKLRISVIPVRTRGDLKGIDGLIIPGGESTTLQKLCEREGMFASMKKVRYIFGTCAGAILLAKTLSHKTKGQKTLELMDIEIDRNAYGRQAHSFEKNIQTNLGTLDAVFIRAPKITSTGRGVVVLAKDAANTLACEQKSKKSYYLAVCFHPEYTSTLFHEHFLKQVAKKG